MNIPTPKNTTVNLFDALGVAAGTRLEVINISNSVVRLYSTEASPSYDDDHIPLQFGSLKGLNDKGDLGAWALSLTGGAIDVRVVG